MEYAIQILEKEKRSIERSIKENYQVQDDMRRVRGELAKISKLKRAIKILKQKVKKR